MAKRIIYTRPDGGVSVVVPARPQRQDETEQEYLAAIQAKAVPANATNVRTIEHTDLPASRRFRNHWRDSSGSVVPDAALSLGQAKQEKIAAIKAKTQELLDQGFTHNGKTFPLDADSQSKWNGLEAKKGNIGYPVKVSAVDGTTLSIGSAAALEAFTDAALARGRAILERQAELIETAVAAATVQAVDAITDDRS